MKAATRSICLVLALLFASPLAAAPSRASAATALAPCKDRAYTLNGTRWTRPFVWRFQARSTPRNLRRRVVGRMLRRAAHTVSAGANRCGLKSSLASRSRDAGRTLARPDIRKDGTCGRPDGANEVGFGTLPTGEMALTCYWSQGGSTVEADLLFNKADYRWITKIEPTCVMEWDLAAVATHEFGHAFGLGHVGEGLHANLTMAPYILPCQASEARLGLGDLLGLRALY